MSLSVGDKFSSFEELEKSVNLFGKTNFTSFWKRECITIEKAKERIKRLISAPPELKYYLIKYTCIHGGKKYTKRVKDNSRKSKTFKQDCPVFIQVLLSSGTLEIRKMHMEHNHLVSESIFKSLPKERRLNKECEEKVAKLLKLQVNRKMLQEELKNETGKQVTLKDIRNIAAKYKQRTVSELNRNLLQNESEKQVTMKDIHNTAAECKQKTVSEAYPVLSSTPEIYEEYPENPADRFKKILLLTQKIAAVACDSTGDDFLKKIYTLKTILNFWEQGKNVEVSASISSPGEISGANDHGYTMPSTSQDNSSEVSGRKLQEGEIIIFNQSAETSTEEAIIYIYDSTSLS